MAHDGSGRSAPLCLDTVQPLGKLLLGQGTTLKNVPKGITVVCMVLIQHKDHSEVFHLFHHYGLQVSEVWVSTPELLVHGHQVTEIQAPPCALHVESNHIEDLVKYP